MKTILLDCFGVATTEGRFLTEIFYPLFPNHFEAELEKAWLEVKHKNIREEDFWKKFGYEPSAGRQALMNSIKPDPHLRELIGYLKRKNYPIVLFSEFPKVWLDALVKAKNWDGLFDKIVSLPNLGYTKHQLPAFSWATKEFGECVFIDDNITYLTLANKARIETVWKKSIEVETSFEPDHIIRYLSELKEIL